MSEKLISLTRIATLLIAYTGGEISYTDTREKEGVSIIHRAMGALDGNRLTTFLDLSDLAVDWVTRKRKGLEVKLPNKLQGNFTVYEIAKDLIKRWCDDSGQKTKFHQEASTGYNRAALSLSARVDTTKSTTSSIDGTQLLSQDTRDCFISLQALALFMEDERDRQIKIRNHYTPPQKMRKLNSEEKVIAYAAYYTMIREKYDVSKLHESGGINIIITGNLILVEYSGMNKIKRRVFTFDHYRRTIELIRTISHFMISNRSIAFRTDPKEFAIDLASILKSMADDNPQKVGEYIKGARGILQYGFDTDPVYHENTVKAYKSTMSPEKLDKF